MITEKTSDSKPEKSLNFIEQKVEEDLANQRFGQIVTRFPPEPNGFLHIGHVKAICLSFDLADQVGGKTNLRFDDTNPVTEDTRYVDGIRNDIRWLGYEWEHECYASDYFGKLHELAIHLIKTGKAYVDDSTQEAIREMRGFPTSPGIESPNRNRSVAENLDLFDRMRLGEYEEGEKVLRAKIDMSSPNMHFRDPIMYRILKKSHHRTGELWCIYPTYDWAHGQSDAIEGVTHSLCSLEFEVHRPLYDWFLDNLPVFNPRPYQTEFSRLNISFMVMSKRKLMQLVNEGHVSGWDDPRMPTIAGLRRRGYTPASLRNFARSVGVTKFNSTTGLEKLEESIREDLNKTASRVMVVLDPLRVVITNYPEGQSELLPLENNPEDNAAGNREVPFSRNLYIEREDFMENPPKDFFRLAPGMHARLKGAYIIRCDEVRKDGSGLVTELLCTYFPESKSGQDKSGIKAKGVLHFVSAAEAIDVEIRLYDRLFTVEDPLANEEKDFLEFINPDSLRIISAAKAEPFIAGTRPGERFQFMRKGYFIREEAGAENVLSAQGVSAGAENLLPVRSESGKPIFNRTVGLRESWGKR